MIRVVGGGIFGVTAALELARRGHAVTLQEPSPLPAPLAESTDISKAVRMDYGGDADYTAFMEEALARWRAFPEYVETGVLYLSRGPMRPGGFEHDSFHTLTKRGHHLERMDADAIARRFPAWRGFTDGYFNPRGGYAVSSRVVARLADEARALGVSVVSAGYEQVTRDADHVVLCAGAWTPRLVPSIAACFRDAGQPVFHLRPAEPWLFERERFPTFGADIATTGYYGFPLDASGVVKIANHGPGRAVHPDSRRDIPAGEEAALRSFLEATFPDLANAPIAHRRTCVYGDTRDEHFWIARDPEREWLTVACGGSGHAFKFAPLLGEWIADTALGLKQISKFRWRPEIAASAGEEAARAR
jgi:glycine/D-amino acid oxidase-like deaminating enzyme